MYDYLFSPCGMAEVYRYVDSNTSYAYIWELGDVMEASVGQPQAGIRRKDKSKQANSF